MLDAPSRSTTPRPYALADWQAGTPPPHGWDVGDCLEDGWSRVDVTQLMREAVCDTLPPWPDAEPADKEERETMRQELDDGLTDLQARAEGDGPAPVEVRAAPIVRATVKANPAKPAPSDVVRNLPASPSLARGSEVEVARAICATLETVLGDCVVSEGGLWAWHRTEWTAIPDQALRLAAHRYDGAIVNGKTELKVGRTFINGVVGEVGTILGQNGFFADQAQALNCLNCVVRIGRAGEIITSEHTPDDRFRFTVSAAFKANTDAAPPAGSLLHKLVHGAFAGDPDEGEKIDLIAEILGAAAFGMATRLPQPKAFVFLGESASNGKSTLAGLLSCLLPESAVCSIPPGAFEDERRVVGLVGKAANVADELSAAGISGEILKAAITGNTISGRGVYKDAVTFAPRALHLFTTNALPRFNGGLDRGLQRRLVVVKFNRVIPGNEIIADILERIRRDELDLLVGFAIGGARRLFRRQAYTMPPSSDEGLRDWLRMDPVHEWFETKVVATDVEPIGGWLRTGDLFKSFRAWALDQGYSEKFLPPVNTFSQRLRTMPGVVLKSRSAGTMATGIDLRHIDSEPPPDWG